MNYNQFMGIDQFPVGLGKLKYLADLLFNSDGKPLDIPELARACLSNTLHFQELKDKNVYAHVTVSGSLEFWRWVGASGYQA